MSTSSKPFGEKIRISIQARAAIKDYTSEDGTSKRSLTVGVSDGSRCYKLMCYNPSDFTKLQVDSVVLLVNYKEKKDENPSYIVATKKTRMFVSGGLSVPADHRLICQGLLTPSVAEIKPIKEALYSPVKAKTSVVGKIVKIHLSAISVKGKEVSIKDIRDQDATGTAKVTLWRESTEIKARVGDYVSITNLVVNAHNKIVSLSGTSSTTVEKTDAPVEAEEVTVEGVMREDTEAVLLLDDMREVRVPGDLLALAIGENELIYIESLTKDGPVRLILTTRGSDVVDIATP